MYRTKPRDDELFSSWLVRLAHGLAIRLQTFTTQVLGMSPGFWTDDVDRHPSHEALRILSAGTAAPMVRLEAMGLSAYEGFLWESYRPRGQLPWVMPVVRHGRRRLGHGQQFCRRCLSEDDNPYFRRRWRLAFNVVCERHAIMLDDACRCCGAPVEFHAGDFGRRLLDLDCPIARCNTCGADLRMPLSNDDREAPSAILNLQSELGAALQDGWSPTLPGGAGYSFLAFDGLRHIVALLASRGRSGRLRDCMLAQDGELPLSAPTRRRSPLFEELRIGDRARILGWCAELLRSWPDEFVRLCRQAQVSSSYIFPYSRTAPYWLKTAVADHLYDRDYWPSAEEWVAARAWLEAAGRPTKINSVRRWLGLSHTRNSSFEPSAPSSRWNPRGPHSVLRKHVPQRS